MTSTDRLTEELRRQAEQITRGLPDQHPLTLDDVRGRARGIRRRRYAATGLAAAAVVAVTVPLGVLAGDRLDRTSTDPVDRPGENRTLVDDATPDPTPDAELDPSPAPELPRRIALTTDVEAATAPVTVPYLAGGVIRTADGSTIGVPGDHDLLLPLGDGFVVGGDAGEGERFTAYLDPSGEPVWTEPSSGGPVLSPSGRLAAFGRAGGTTVTVPEGGERQALTTRVPDGYLVAAVTDRTDGTGTCQETDAGCTVWSNSTMTVDALAQSTGRAGDGDLPTDEETIDDLPALVEAVSVTGELALTVSTDGLGGLCSAVTAPGGARSWRTCERRLGEFSPDGRFLLGYPLEDGPGPRSVALLDARTGTVLREYAAQGRSDVFVRQAVWDSDGSVVATVWDTDHWAVLRMTLEGQLTSLPVEGLEGADDADAAPVVLAGNP